MVRGRCRGEGGEPRLVVSRCCCLSLRTAALLLAATEIVFLVALIILHLILRPIQEGVALAVEGLLHVGVASVLVHGVRTHQRRLVWAWVVVRAVLLVMEMPVLVIYSVFTHYTVTLALLAICALVCCSILVVRSYALTMDADDEGVTLEEVTANNFTRLQEDRMP